MTDLPQKIPKPITEKYVAIAALVDAFCTKHLNEDVYKRQGTKSFAALHGYFARPDDG